MKSSYWKHFFVVLVVFLGISFVIFIIFWLIAMFLTWELYLLYIDWVAVRMYTVAAVAASLFLAADD